MAKFSFFLGVGVGYFIGTRSGRQQLGRMRSAGQQMWDHPRVQEQVTKVEGKVSQVAREQGAAMTDRVADMVKARISGDASGNDVSRDRRTSDPSTRRETPVGMDPAPGPRLPHQ